PLVVVRIMPKPEPNTATPNEFQEHSGSTKPEIDKIPAQNAYRVIDSYVFAVWKEPPPSPASQNDITTLADKPT
ncbi:MAG: hypothetical protein WBD95_09650, partial [Xanthobacteraceae bacterium]